VHRGNKKILEFQHLRGMFSRISNLRIHEFFSQNFSCFLHKQGTIFLLRSKILLKMFIFTKKRDFASPLKENKAYFLKKKSWIRGLKIRENMS